MSARAWSPIEDLRLKRLVKKQIPQDEIARLLRRTLGAIRVRLSYLKGGEEGRLRRREAERRRYQELKTPDRASVGARIYAPPEIPETVLAERDSVLARHHSDLTAALMGDPLPGRRAIDRMQHA